MRNRSSRAALSLVVAGGLAFCWRFIHKNHLPNLCARERVCICSRSPHPIGARRKWANLEAQARLSSGVVGSALFAPLRAAHAPARPAVGGDERAGRKKQWPTRPLAGMPLLSAGPLDHRAPTISHGGGGGGGGAVNKCALARSPTTRRASPFLLDQKSREHGARTWRANVLTFARPLLPVMPTGQLDAARPAQIQWRRWRRKLARRNN